MSYQEQLRDPRWQKKRLEIMARDEWTCRLCGDTDATLTVHHKSYRQNDGVFVDIWDYENSWLITLCEKCHSSEEDYLSEVKKDCFFKLRDYCENAFAIEEAIGLIYKLMKKNGGRLDRETILKAREAICDD